MNMSGTPSIRISQHQRLASPPRYPSFAAPAAPTAPMAIRGAQEPVPPPLPPPSYIPEITAGHDPGWQWGNDPNKSDFGRPASVKPGSSLLGGGNGNGFGAMKSARQEKEHEYPQYCSAEDARRGSSVSTLTITRDHYDMPDGSRTPSDEGGSLSRPSSNYRYVCSHFISVCTVCVTLHPSDPIMLQLSPCIWANIKLGFMTNDALESTIKRFPTATSHGRLPFSYSGCSTSVCWVTRHALSRSHQHSSIMVRIFSNNPKARNREKDSANASW